MHCDDKNNRSTRLNARSFTRNISHRAIISAAHHHLQAIRMPTTAHIANGSAECISFLYSAGSHSSLSVTNPLLLSPRCIILLLGWRHPLRLFFSITIRAWEDARLWIFAICGGGLGLSKNLLQVTQLFHLKLPLEIYFPLEFEPWDLIFSAMRQNFFITMATRSAFARIESQDHI